MRHLTDYHGVLIRPEHEAADRCVVDDLVLDDCYRIADLPQPIEYALDIGAHVGAFAIKLRDARPGAAVCCVEVEPDNADVLRANVEGFAAVIEAACTYEISPILYSRLNPGTENTGGSWVAAEGSARSIATSNDPQAYRAVGRVDAITIEEIIDRLGWPRLDVLKLDCEGSELCILAHCQCIDRIGVIVGEYHEEKLFKNIVRNRFADWTYDELRGGEPGVFRLSRPDWWNMASVAET